jgi:FLYWCH zinc finger domain
MRTPLVVTSCNHNELALNFRFVADGKMDVTCIVPGNRRGGFALIHASFRYVRRNKTKHKIYWQCSTAGCSAYAQTNLFNVSAHEDTDINGKKRISYRTSVYLVVTGVM